MELWDLLNEQGKKTGKTMIRGERLRFGQFHLVVHIWIMNSSGQLLIQKRAPQLLLMPGVWAITGGSAVHGEDSEMAAGRELAEELGINTSPGELHCFGHLRRRNSFSDLWLLKRDVTLDELTLQPEEVADAKWVTWDRLNEMVHEHTFHNYGRSYFDTVFKQLFDPKNRPRRKA